MYFKGLRRAKVERKTRTRKVELNPNKPIKDGEAKGIPEMVPIEDIETWYNGDDDYM